MDNSPEVLPGRRRYQYMARIVQVHLYNKRSRPSCTAVQEGLDSQTSEAQTQTRVGASLHLREPGRLRTRRKRATTRKRGIETWLNSFDSKRANVRTMMHLLLSFGTIHHTSRNRDLNLRHLGIIGEKRKSHIEFACSLRGDQDR